MVRLNTHKIQGIPDKDFGDRVVKEVTPLEQAYWLGNIFSQYVKNLGLSEEKGVLILSLEDGPLVTMEIVERLSGKNLDFITPVYLAETSSPSVSLLNLGKLSNLKAADGTSMLHSAGLSVFSNGKNGEPFLTSVESLFDVNKEKQISLNAEFPLGRISNIQKTLDFFAKDLEVELGVVRDSSIEQSKDKDFTSYFDVSIDNQEESRRIQAHFRRFLFTDSFPSPARMTEAIRSIVLGMINKGNIEYIQLLKQLDPIYEKLAPRIDIRLSKSNSNWINERNKITTALIRQMRRQQILKISSEKGTMVSKGENWEKYNEIFLEAYLAFSEEIGI